MTINLLFNFSIIIFVAIIIALSTRFFPVKRPFERSSLSPVVIAKYIRFEKLSGPLFIIFCVGMLFVWHALLQNLTISQSNLHKHNVFSSYTKNADLLVLAFFLSLTSSFPLVSLLFRLLLKEQFNSYVQFSSHRARFNIWQATNTFATFSFFVFVVISLLSINSYIRATPNEIIINRFFSLRESKYNYQSQIVSIEQVHYIEQTDTSSTKNVYFLTRFTDGTRWRTASYTRDAVPESITDIVLYVSQQSGLPIQIVEE